MKIESGVVGNEIHKYTEIEPIQGDLKLLTNESYENLKHKLITLKFSEPIGIWKHNGHNYILSGTQRWRVVKEMVEREGYESPDLPCFVIEARDTSEAKKKVLSLCCQYGDLDQNELYKFIQDIDIKPEEIQTLKIPGLDNLDFMASFMDPEPPKKRRYERVCPSCGCVFTFAFCIFSYHFYLYKTLAYMGFLL